MRLRALPGRRDLVWLPAGRDRLELIATDNLTLQPVTGKFPVVGVWQNGLIVERDGHCAGC
ncbi:MAG: hypothetical protein IPM89_09300 [Candidatus Competibacteraceae bacterium]|nr:MAG: hypothetical protein IPM89_09300 [Candidatus Competibacteraceae bacterium]